LSAILNFVFLNDKQKNVSVVCGFKKWTDIK